MTWSPLDATALFDVQRDGVVVIAPDDTVAFANRTVLNWLGSRAEAIVGRPLIEVFPEVEVARARDWLALMRSGTGPTRTVRFAPGLGAWFELDAHLDGDHLVCLVTDVTERKRGEAEHALITEISSLISRSDTWSGTVDGLAEVLRRSLGYDLAEVWSWSPRRDAVRLQSLSVDPAGPDLGEFVDATVALRPERNAVHRRANGNHRRVLVRELGSDPTFRRADAARAVGLHSAAHARINVDRNTSLLVGLFRRGPIADDSDTILERAVVVIADLLSRRRSGLELERFFDLSREYVAITGLGGGFRRVNPAMVEALGYGADELLSIGYATILHPDDIDGTARVIDELVRTGTPVEHHENRIRTASGEYRWVSWKAQVLSGEGVVFCTGRDVTEERRNRIRREVEAEVLQAVAAGEPLETSLRAVARMVEDADPALICAVAVCEPLVSHAGAGTLRIVGTSSLPEQVRAALDASSHEAATRWCARYLTGSVPAAGELSEWPPPSLLTVDPALGLASTWAVPIVGNERQVLGALAVFSREPGPPSPGRVASVEDACRLAAVAIQRSASDAAIIQSDERFRMLADLITDAAWDWDLVAETRWRNQGFWTLFGYEPIELDGTDTWWRARVHPDDLGPLLASRERALSGSDDFWSSEYRFLRADGEYAEVLIRARIVRDQQGTPIRMVGGMTDITERRSIEREYLRAQRLESLGTLAGGIAHDLNNSLMPVLMAVDQLLADDVDDDQREYLEVIAASAVRSAEMVRRILGFARGLEGAAAPISLAEVVRSAVRLIRDMFPKNVELIVDDDCADCMVRGDLTQLHQVLMNLALNARDAMPDGGRLTISIDDVVFDERAAAAARGETTGGMSEVTAGSYARIRVSDTGTGVAHAVLDRLFEPFFTTKTRTDGTGLGLATSLAIVRGHGGGIAVTSEVGTGSTFAVHLPLEADLSPPVGLVRPVEETSAPAPVGGGATILVVDDEPAVRTVIRESLVACGYRVVEAASGTEGLDALLRDPGSIDLVLTDVMMPAMDGVEFVRRLRATEPILPVLAMTGLDDPVRSAALAEEGVLAMISKPFDRRMLLSALEAVLDTGS